MLSDLGIVIGAAFAALIVARLVQLSFTRKLDPWIPAEQPGESKLIDDQPAKPIETQGIAPKILNELRRAGWRLRPSDFIIIIAFSTFTGVLIGYAITRYWPLAVCFGPFFGAVPYIVLRWKQNARVLAFYSQLPDALFFISSAMKAGSTFAESVSVAANEMSDPMGEELKQIIADLRIGLREMDAIKRMRERMGLVEIDLLAAGVELSLRTGGRLGDILETIANTIRARFKIASEIRAVTADGRISAVILIAVPIIMLIILSIINPQYMKPLIAEPIGHVLLFVMFVFEALGAIVIRRMLVKMMGDI